MSLFFLGAIVIAPALVALWNGIVRARPFQFGMPVLLVLPLAATPSIAGLAYAWPTKYRGVACVAIAFMAVYQGGFGLLLWAKGERSRWTPALNLLVGVVLGTLVMFVWAAIVLGVCDHLR